MFTVAVVMGYNPNTMSVVPQIKEKKSLDIILVSLLLQLRVMLIHPVHGKMSVKQLVFSGLEDFARIVCPALFIFLSKSQVGLAGMAARVAHSPLTPFFSQIVENKR